MDNKTQDWPTVFISYSNKNIEAAQMVRDALEDENHTCFFAKDSIKAGYFWADDIVEAITHAKVMVLLISPEFNDSVQTRKEIILGIESGLAILPIRIADFLPRRHLKYFLCDCQWIDAPEGNLVNRLDFIVEIVKKLPGLGLKRTNHGVCIDFQGERPDGLVNAKDIGIELSKAFLDLRIPRKRIVEPIQPSQFLQPYNRFIPLIGRETEIKNFKKFLKEPGNFRWQVYHGEGGIGKTRFAIECARIASSDGWFAGFIDGFRLHAFVNSDGLLHWCPTLPTLVFIDYAASKVSVISKLFNMLAGIEAQNSNSDSIRVVLLERHADEHSGWLSDVLSTGEGEIRDIIQRECYSGVRVLSSVSSREDDHTAGYNSTREIIQQTFTAWEKKAKVSAPSLPDFDLRDWRRIELNTGKRPLYIQMAAVYACETGSAKNLPLWGRGELLQAAVSRERDYVKITCGESDLKSAVEYIAAFLCIAGVGLSYKRGWLRKVDNELKELGLKNLSSNQIEKKRKAIFNEPVEIDPDSGIGLIQPDIVSEGFAAIVLKEQENPPIETLKVILDHSGIRAWSNIIRMVQDLDGLENFERIRDWLPNLIENRPVQELMEVSSMLPDRTVSLNTFSWLLNETILTRPDSNLSLVQRGKILLSLIYHRYCSGKMTKGDLDKMKRELEECEKIYNKVDITSDMQDLLTMKARVCHYRGFYHKMDNNFEAAKKEFIKGVLIAGGNDISRVDGEQSKKDLSVLDNFIIPVHPLCKKEIADCLNSYSLTSDTPEDKCKASEYAVNIGEQLIKNNYRLYAGDLARYLNNLSIALKLKNNFEAAKKYSKRSVSIRGKLMTNNPDEYGLAYIHSLNTLMELEKNNYEEGRSISEKMLRVHKDLAVRNPVRFLKDLSLSYHRIGYFSFHEGHYAYGLEQTKKGLRIRENMVEYDFDANALDLAWSHHNAGAFYEEVGDKLDKAVAHSVKAYDLRTQFQDKFPDFHVENIVQIINRLIKLYDALNDPSNKQKWQEILLKQLKEDKFEDPYEIAHACYGLAENFENQGNRKKAMESIEISVEKYRPVYDFDTEELKSSLADCCNLAAAMVLLGDWTEDLDILHQSEKISSKVLDSLKKEKVEPSHIWGAIKNNLGHSIYRQGEIKKDPKAVTYGIKVLEEAIRFQKDNKDEDSFKETLKVVNMAQKALFGLTLELNGEQN